MEVWGLKPSLKPNNLRRTSLHRSESNVYSIETFHIISKSARKAQSATPEFARDVQYYWNKCQKLLCRSILISIIHLFPHVEIIICTSIEFKRYPLYPMKHQIR